MRVLQLHAELFEYEPVTREIDEEYADQDVSLDKVRLQDLVVTLVAIEEGDDISVVKFAAQDIKRYMQGIKNNKLLIYPYSHLSSNLASPQQALAIMNMMKEETMKEDIEVKRAPFGWTKSFSVKVKAHPLAENFRTYDKSSITKYSDKESGSISKTALNNSGTGISSALSAEDSLRSQWFVLKPDGNMIPLKEYKYLNNQSNLKSLISYEIEKRRAVDEIPPHVKLMRKLAIADYEPASDSGNMRFYPKGRLIKSLIEQYVTKMVSDYGGIEIETPIMYDSKHPSLESYFNRFPARQYNIATDHGKHYFLRFAACFGQFLMAKDLLISYKNLPLRLYELTRYSFRREKTGEVVGLKRLRAFSMPDCHAFCRNMEEAKSELLKRFDLSTTVLNDLGISTSSDIEMAIRFTENCFQENKDMIIELARKFDRPVLVELWKERFFYFILKWEFNFIDSQGKASALSTDQIDIENSKRYNITFVDEDGSKKYPVILHNSPSGAIERVIYALLEKAAKSSKTGEKPTLPLWLSPTQMRLIPVTSNHTAYCKEIADTLSKKYIRVDLDDRDESVGKKIRDAEMEWINYIVVIGDTEVEEAKFQIRDRLNLSERRTMTIDGLADEITNKTADKPYLPLNLPMLLSKRPQFTG
ncbi:MAG: threonine--tRNA ligase [Nitrososphaeraceae archaeon]|jgi:threonyl-tRNA synthetase